MKSLALLAMAYLAEWQVPTLRFDLRGCQLKSTAHPVLTEGSWRETICLEAVAALEGVYGDIPEERPLEIEVQEWRSRDLVLWLRQKGPGREVEGHALLQLGPGSPIARLLTVRKAP